MPAVTGPRSAAADAAGILAAKLLGPASNHLVTNFDAAGRQHLLDHAEAQGKEEIEPDCEADHLGKKTVASVERRTRLLHTASYLGTRSRLVNVTMPGTGSGYLVALRSLTSLRAR
jgi:hypothetical protein